jgi:hypothetical protein
MSPPRRKRTNPARSNRPPRPKALDMWRSVPELPDPEPVAPTTDPAVLIRSLGDPPVPGNAIVAGHYLATVVERAAALATALAASADLLAPPDPD